jgi:hypothetical protein
MGLDAALKFDYSELIAANSKAEEFEKTMRRISGGGGAGGGGAGGGGGGGAAEGSKTFRQWDTELRHVERSGRGLLALFGIGGGILGAAMLVKNELKAWYAALDQINRGAATLGGKIADLGPNGRNRLALVEGQARAAGLTPSAAAEAMEKGDLGSAMASGRRRVAALKAGAAAGNAPEQSALAALNAETDQSWGGFAPSTAPQGATQKRAAKRVSENLGRALDLEAAGFALSDAQKKEGVSAFGESWMLGTRGVSQNQWAEYQKSRARRASATPQEIIITDDRSFGGSTGR